MPPHTHPGHVIQQDTALDDSVPDILAELPFTHDEVNELLYEGDRSAADRLERLHQLADHLRDRQAGDLADGDPGRLLAEVESAISEIEAGVNAGGMQGMMADPHDHRETLPPDSDEFEEIEDEDARSVEDDIGRV